MFNSKKNKIEKANQEVANKIFQDLVRIDLLLINSEIHQRDYFARLAESTEGMKDEWRKFIFEEIELRVKYEKQKVYLMNRLRNEFGIDYAVLNYELKEE